METFYEFQMKFFLLRNHQIFQSKRIIKQRSTVDSLSTKKGEEYECETQTETNQSETGTKKNMCWNQRKAQNIIYTMINCTVTSLGFQQAITHFLKQSHWYVIPFWIYVSEMWAVAGIPCGTQYQYAPKRWMTFYDGIKGRDLQRNVRDIHTVSREKKSWIFSGKEKKSCADGMKNRLLIC